MENNDRTKSVAVIVVGTVMTLPFMFVVASTAGSHVIGLEGFAIIAGMVIGSPLIIIGLISFFVFGDYSDYNNGSNSNSLAQQDLARIRYAVELEGRKK